MTIDNATIKRLALEAGFALKHEIAGEPDLKPYVYDFARALINATLDDAAHQLLPALRSMVSRGEAVETILQLKRP